MSRYMIYISIADPRFSHCQHYAYTQMPALCKLGMCHQHMVQKMHTGNDVMNMHAKNGMSFILFQILFVAEVIKLNRSMCLSALSC